MKRQLLKPADTLAGLLEAARAEAMPKAPIKRRRASRKRRKPDPLKPALKEARRLKREINVRLSQAFSEALGFGVRVTIAAQVPASPDMKRARRSSRSAFDAFNAP